MSTLARQDLTAHAQRKWAHERYSRSHRGSVPPRTRPKHVFRSFSASANDTERAAHNSARAQRIFRPATSAQNQQLIGHKQAMLSRTSRLYVRTSRCCKYAPSSLAGGSHETLAMCAHAALTHCQLTLELLRQHNCRRHRQSAASKVITCPQFARLLSQWGGLGRPD